MESGIIVVKLQVLMGGWLSEEKILKGLVGILEEHFPEARIFRPRDIRLDYFAYINDEEIDKYDEWAEDEVVDLTEDIEKTVAREIEADPSIIPISAVDASSAKLGETNRGVISAVRVAIWKQEPGQKPKLYVYGPYLAHITSDNVDFVYNYFWREIFGFKERKKAPQIHKMTDRLRNFFERLAQRQASRITKNGITLWDGSLTGGTVDTPVEILKDSLRLAQDNNTSVVGISKHSVLKTESGERILEMLDREMKPCFKDVHEKISPSLASRILGRVHVVKFTPTGFSFRVDVKPAPNASCTDVLELLRGNCTFYNGYPDPLREAHIHAYFTPDELMSLQNMAIKKYDMEVLPSFDVRRHILAPFG